MKLMIDGDVLDGAPAGAGEALAAGLERARELGRVVVRVDVDGRIVEESRLAGGLVGVTGEEMLLTTAEPSELTAATARQAIEALEQARETHGAVVACLDRGDRDEALGKLAEAFDSWSAARETLELGARLLGVDLDSFVATSSKGPVRAAGAIEGLVGALGEARDAIQRADDSALADVVAGPLSEAIDGWQALLSMLASVAEA